MMNDDDDQEVVLVEGEGRRSLVSFGRRARWRILQQSGNKETKRFLHAIFMKIVGIVIVQRSEMSQCSVSVILTSSGLRTLGAWALLLNGVRENDSLLKALNMMGTLIASALIFCLLSSMTTYGLPHGLSRVRATHIRKSIQTLDFSQSYNASPLHYTESG